MMLARNLILIACVCLLVMACAGQTSTLYGVDPGKARVSTQDDRIVLENKMFTARWSLAQGRVAGSELVAHPSEKSIPLSKDLFILKFSDGGILRSSTMRIKDGARIESLRVAPEASQAAQHSPGQQVALVFEDSERKLQVTWRGTLRDGSNYVRQEVSFHAASDQPITEVELIDFMAPSAMVDGTVKGSPVIMGNVFAGFEHPLSVCEVKNEEAVCSIHRELPLRAGQTVTYSSVIGLTPASQMRRGFLNYIERERARPYRPFLHYNSWYDIGYNNPYDEAAALDAGPSITR